MRPSQLCTAWPELPSETLQRTFNSLVNRDHLLKEPRGIRISQITMPAEPSTAASAEQCHLAAGRCQTSQGHGTRTVAQDSGSPASAIPNDNSEQTTRLLCAPPTLWRGAAWTKHAETYKAKSQGFNAS